MRSSSRASSSRFLLCPQSMGRRNKRVCLVRGLLLPIHFELLRGIEEVLRWLRLRLLPDCVCSLSLAAGRISLLLGRQVALESLVRARPIVLVRVPVALTIFIV